MDRQSHLQIRIGFLHMHAIVKVHSLYLQPDCVFTRVCLVDVQWHFEHFPKISILHLTDLQ